MRHRGRARRPFRVTATHAQGTGRCLRFEARRVAASIDAHDRVGSHGSAPLGRSATRPERARARAHITRPGTFTREARRCGCAQNACARRRGRRRLRRSKRKADMHFVLQVGRSCANQRPDRSRKVHPQRLLPGAVMQAQNFTRMRKEEYKIPSLSMSVQFTGMQAMRKAHRNSHVDINTSRLVHAGLAHMNARRHRTEYMQ